jgi:hypothetical protein
MKTHEITIQTNIFNAIQIPTTQEDNFGGIIDKYELFHKYHNENNGNETALLVGVLAKYYSDFFMVFHGTIKYNIPREDIIIKSFNNEKDE